jgi:hypothetical protein
MYIEFDELTNTIDYLEKTDCFLKTIRNEPQNWKWIIISFYLALYGAMICTAQDTDYTNVLKKGNKEKLQDFDQVKGTLKRKGELILTKDMNRNLNLLKAEFRHQFEHFIPCGWSIEISGFPQIFLNLIPIIENLLFETDTKRLFDFRKIDIEKTKLLITNIKEELRLLQKIYNVNS